MSIDFKEKNVKYLNRDFSSFKRDLMEYTKAHQSGAFQDYNETSSGMAILELVSYVGDVLSHYQDMQFEELKENAKQIENVTSFAKALGYRPSGKRPSIGIVSVLCEVPSRQENGEYIPNEIYCPVLRESSKLQGPNGVVFETIEDVIFSASAPTEGTSITRMVTGSQFDPDTGVPTFFALRKDVQVIAAETITDVVQVGSFEQHKEIELSYEDVVEVLSVNDSDGNEWTEVDFLAQETVYDFVTNSDTDNTLVPYVLKLRSVPRRFITNRDPLTNKTTLIFGSGDGVSFDDALIPNAASFALPASGKSKISSFSIDPQNFLKTSTLGLSPSSTVLSIDYRVGGGSKTNVPQGSIKSFVNAVLDFSSVGLDPSAKARVEESIECINVSKIDGGNQEESVEEIKANRAAYFAAQDRVVTREDYVARLYSLPAKCGKVEKVYVRRDALNARAINIHILSKDSDGVLSQASTTLIKNIKKFLSSYRMLTDGVNLMTTDIINLSIEFGVVVSTKLNRNKVLSKCLSTLKDNLSNDKLQIGQPLVLSDLTSLLQAIEGVISVYSFKIKNVFGSRDGLDYSDNLGNSVRFDVQSWTQNGILYCPENSIFQIKYPNKDIFGEAR